MSEECSKVICSFLSQLSPSDWLDFFGIIVPVGVALYSLKKAYDDSVKQNKFSNRMELYSDIAAYFGSIKLPNEPYFITKEDYVEFQKLFKKSYFIASKSVYEIIVRINEIYLLAVKSEGTILKDIGISTSINLLLECMKWEFDNKMDISSEQVKKLQDNLKEN
ncbi:hypothetical protein AB1I63_05340 [Streptococcus pneumoniae]